MMSSNTSSENSEDDSDLASTHSSDGELSPRIIAYCESNTNATITLASTTSSTTKSEPDADESSIIQTDVPLKSALFIYPSSCDGIRSDQSVVSSETNSHDSDDNSDVSSTYSSDGDVPLGSIAYCGSVHTGKPENTDMEALVYLLLCGGSCVVRDGDDDDDDDDEDDNDDVLRLMLPLFPKATLNSISQKLLYSHSKYLVQDENNFVNFCNHAMYDDCLYATDKRYPGFIWKICDPVFECSVQQYSINLPKFSVFISKHNTKLLISQIIDDIRQCKFQHALSHGILGIKENVDMLFSQLGENWQDLHLHSAADSFLFWVVQSTNNYLMTKSLFEKTGLKQTEVDQYLLHCISKDQTRSFLCLREQLIHMQNQGISYRTNCIDSNGNTLFMMALERRNGALVEVLIADRGNCLVKNSVGNTALHIACLGDYRRVVRMIINDKPSCANMPGQGMRTPIMMAALKGNHKLYQYLADEVKCTLTRRDENGDSILHLACVGGNLQVVKHLISRGPCHVNQRGQYGRTPLMIAAHFHHRELFDWLLAQKCEMLPNDFNIKFLVSSSDVKGFRDIHAFLQTREVGSGKHARKRGHFLQNNMLKVTLESKGSNLSFVDEIGMSLLHTAANTGHLELAHFILKNSKEDINIRDGYGRTPVMLAAAAGQSQMVNFLMNMGCNISLRDKSSSGVLHFACQGGNASIVDKAFCHCSIDINWIDDYGKTPVSYSVQKGEKHVFDKLLNKGSDLSVVDRNKNTLLHLACKGGNLSIVEHLLSLGLFDIDQVNSNDRTPLLVAVDNGHTEVCHHLISIGANLHMRYQGGNDALLVAADQGNNSLIEYILTVCKADIFNKDKSGKTAPMKAAEKGYSEVFGLFMRKGGFDLSERDRVDNSILHVASVGGNVNIVRDILSEDKVDINGRDMYGRTPLMLAAEKGHGNVVNLLMDKGCDTSLEDEDSYNVLHFASMGGNEEIVKSVLPHMKSYINKQGRDGRTPVMWAVNMGHRRVFDILVAEGSDLSVQDTEGYTLLHVVCFQGSVDTLQYILSQNIIDINTKERRGRTPVMLAAEREHRGVFDLLVSRSCGLTAVDRYSGYNILHVACIGGNIHIVQYILSQNLIDINSRDRYRMSPVMWAAQKGRKEVFDVLVSRGCDLSIVNRDGDNILHAACMGGSVGIVQNILTENIVGIYTLDSKCRTPAEIAEKYGHHTVMEVLRRRENGWH